MHRLVGVSRLPINLSSSCHYFLYSKWKNFHIMESIATLPIEIFLALQENSNAK